MWQGNVQEDTVSCLAEWDYTLNVNNLFCITAGISYILAKIFCQVTGNKHKSQTISTSKQIIINQLNIHW